MNERQQGLFPDAADRMEAVDSLGCRADPAIALPTGRSARRTSLIVPQAKSALGHRTAHLRDRQRKLVAKIDSALRRLDEGEYGYCEVTGDPNRPAPPDRPSGCHDEPSRRRKPTNAAKRISRDD